MLPKLLRKMTPIGVHLGDPFGHLSEAGSRGWTYVGLSLEEFWRRWTQVAQMGRRGGSNGPSRELKSSSSGIALGVIWVLVLNLSG